MNSRCTSRRAFLAAATAGLCWRPATAAAQVRLADESDRSACRSWMVALADAQFYRPSPDVADCAGLVRHALREALRPHNPEWMRRWAIPGMPTYPDVRSAQPSRQLAWPLFRVGEARFAEFADAKTIVRYNTRLVDRDLKAVRPGDLLYFHRSSGREPHHLMMFVGPSSFDRTASDWVVYHTGPDQGAPGEMRKVRAADLVRHPAEHWRPVAGNQSFVGVFRLSFL